MQALSRRSFTKFLGSLGVALPFFRGADADTICVPEQELQSQTYEDLSPNEIFYWIDAVWNTSRGSVAWYLNKPLNTNAYLSKAQILGDGPVLLASWYFQAPTAPGNYVAPYFISYNLDLLMTSTLTFVVEITSPNGVKSSRYTVDLAKERSSNRLVQYLPAFVVKDAEMRTAFQKPVWSQYRMNTCYALDAALDNCLFDPGLGSDSPNCSDVVRYQAIMANLGGCKDAAAAASEPVKAVCPKVEADARLGVHFPKVQFLKISGNSFAARMDINHPDLSAKHYIKYAWLSDPVGRLLGFSSRTFSGQKSYSIVINAFDPAKDLAPLSLTKNQVAILADCPFVRVFFADVQDGIFMSQIHF